MFDEDMVETTCCMYYKAEVYVTRQQDSVTSQEQIKKTS